MLLNIYSYIFGFINNRTFLWPRNECRQYVCICRWYVISVDLKEEIIFTDTLTVPYFKGWSQLGSCHLLIRWKVERDILYILASDLEFWFEDLMLHTAGEAVLDIWAGLWWCWCECEPGSPSATSCLQFNTTQKHKTNVECAFKPGQKINTTTSKFKYVDSTGNKHLPSTR